MTELSPLFSSNTNITSSDSISNNDNINTSSNRTTPVYFTKNSDDEDQEEQFEFEFKALEELANQQCLKDDFNTFLSAQSISNISKNRYEDVLPLEKTRVCLNEKDFSGSDYINANFIGSEKPEYICCQAPLPHTVNAFWQMVFENKSPIIFMLTPIQENGVIKAHIYWPNDSKIRQYGKIFVELKSVHNVQNIRDKNHFIANPKITIRKLLLRHSKTCETHEVIQYHYTGWSDNCSCANSNGAATLPLRFLLFAASEVNNSRLSQKVPITVHCSAGIGRAGTFIAINCSLLHMNKMNSNNNPEVYNIVASLRTQRRGLVQSIEQYKLIYRALEDCVNSNTILADLLPINIESNNNNNNTNFNSNNFFNNLFSSQNLLNNSPNSNTTTNNNNNNTTNSNTNDDLICITPMILHPITV
eukprot:TRINITY_DN500_c1_g2_i1.p1 TRINITY_DN500_c1_g2~~TRINITY_DN500_c1_g2_i1.p1  ORF type:complete len:417 (+),score=173.76 TRINITY_DN500_c1_g2_i1:437-1687(+)